MLGFKRFELEMLCRRSGLSEGQPITNTNLRQAISKVIEENNEEIERQLIEKGIINRA